MCECGNAHIAKSRNLKIGKTKSCGCLGTGPDVKDLTGQRFNWLTTIELFDRDKDRVSIYLCVCDCGNLKEIRQRALVTGKQISCGCYILSLKRRRGLENPRYDLSKLLSERVERRYLEGYTFWRDEVKRLANYICTACKKKASGKLISHHLESYHNNPTLRTDINNGACLCKDCHNKFHKRYGRLANTRQQFEEFVKCQST